MKIRSLTATIICLFVSLIAAFQTVPPLAAATGTPSPSPTRTATPTNLSDTLEIELSDDFSPDLIADITIGTGGQRKFLECTINIVNGAIDYDDGPQELEEVPDFRTQIPSICSDQEIKAGDVQVFAPNGNQTQVALFSLNDENNDGHLIYVAAVPLGAFLTPGQWHIALFNPVQADLFVTLPRITQTIFLRGTLSTGILAGFQPFEQVRAFAYNEINGGRNNWMFAKSFEFGVNQFGYRVISLKDLQTNSVVFVGQQGSFYISNGAFQGNGSSQSPRQVDFSTIQRVWSAQPGVNPPPNTGNTTERVDFHGVTQVFVPAGCFLMGSDALGDINNQIRMHSQRQVCISQDYWIDKYEVSNAQWEQFRQETGSPQANLENFQTSTGSDTPRVGMTLAQAQAYAQWRGGHIPTEAEWEYAARGPNAPLYPWGNTFTNQANTYGTAGGTVSVMSYPEGASWVGALNMAGNAGEWVSDCYDAGFDAQMITSDPIGPCNGSNEMVKGSSFGFNSYPAQSAYRFVNPPGRYWFDVGLRVVSPG